MRYLDESNVRAIGFPWHDIIETIRVGVGLLSAADFSQPIKPYLRFGEPKNRIIAMPAYVGGAFNVAGIKWIASFPDNIKRGMKRAHSVVILNDADNGMPLAFINTAKISGIRTAGVSAYVLETYLAAGTENTSQLTAGIIGFGPVGQLHLQMLLERFQERIDKVYLFDISGIDPSLITQTCDPKKIEVCNNWEEVYNKSNIFITCTVSDKRYVNLSPRKGSLYMNISLRDFDVHFLRDIDLVVVDSWEEVCRENTDIEVAHKSFGLAKGDVYEITQLLNFQSMPVRPDSSIMFCPMGLAVFDIIVANYYYNLAVERGYGIEFEASE